MAGKYARLSKRCGRPWRVPSFPVRIRWARPRRKIQRRKLLAAQIASQKARRCFLPPDTKIRFPKWHCCSFSDRLPRRGLRQPGNQRRKRRNFPWRCDTQRYLNLPKALRTSPGARIQNHGRNSWRFSCNPAHPRRYRASQWLRRRKSQKFCRKDIDPSCRLEIPAQPLPPREETARWARWTAKDDRWCRYWDLHIS